MAYLHWKSIESHYQLFADDILLVTCQLSDRKFTIDQTSYSINNDNNTFICYEIKNDIEIAQLELNQQEGKIYFKDQITYTFNLETSSITVYSLDNLVFSLSCHSNQFSIQTGIAVFEADLFLLLVGFVFTFFADKNLKQTINF